jgi:hypothetical protein
MLTNNLMSNIMCQSRTDEPKAGDGVTICGYTDRYVGTIWKVDPDGVAWFTTDSTAADKTKPLGVGHQEWIHTPNPDADPAPIKKDRKGIWRVGHRNEKGKWSFNSKCSPATIGRKDYYHDWSF